MQKNILLFHKITEIEQDWEDLSIAKFSTFLTLANSQGITFSSLRNNLSNNILTFDDGYASDYELVFPLLKKYQFTATFFICPGKVGCENYMNWDQIKELNDSGMEIGSHSMSHPFISTLGKDEIFQEIKNSKEFIESKTHEEVISFAFPYGDYSNLSLKLAKTVGYSYICSSKPGLSNLGDNLLRRNNVNSSFSLNSIDPLIAEKLRFRYRFDSVKYEAIFFLKKLIGVQNYLKLKKIIKPMTNAK